MDTPKAMGGMSSLPDRHPRFMRHLRAPCHIGSLDTANGRATGVGSCGDSMRVYLRVEAGQITDMRCTYEGCQYTLACASAVSKLACGRTLDHALQLVPADVAAELGGLPEDHLHCARLAVNTLGEAIDDFYQWERRRQGFQSG